MYTHTGIPWSASDSTVMHPYASACLRHASKYSKNIHQECILAVYIYINIYICEHIYIYKYINIYMNIYIYIYIYIYIHGQPGGTVGRAVGIETFA